MRPGMQCVLQVLRAQAGPHAKPAIALAEWKSALTLAERDHILPSFIASLRAGELPLPPEILPDLSQAERDATAAAFWWTHELKGVLADFAARQIPVIALKGPSLAERLYGAVSLRPCRDLDLLVRHPDLPSAGALLASLGFIPDPSPDDYHHPWHRGATTVELHFNVENPLAFDLGIDAIWERAHPAEFAGQPLLLLAPPDELLFLCLHGLRHGYARMGYILDVAHAFDRLYPRRIEPESAQGWRSQADLDHLLILGRALALRLFPDQSIPKIPASPQTTAHIEALAATLWQTLLDRPVLQMNWQQQHRLYLQAEPSTTRRLLRRARHLRILATRLIDRDFAFAAQFGVRNTAGVRLLRPVRLLAQKFPTRT